MVVSREGKGPARLGQVTSEKKNESESPFLMSKEYRRYQNRVVVRTAGQVPTGPVYGRNGIRHIGGLISGEAIIRNMGTFDADANGEATSGMNHEGESTNAAPRGGTPRSSDEVGESRRSEGGVCSEATSIGPTRKGRSLKDEAKPFCISRWEVWEAYLTGEEQSRGGRAGWADDRGI